MANFIRRFLFDPGIETLLEIESVNILDLEPPADIQGIGAGCVLAVGEFENGPFVQYEVGGASDFKRTFGSFGYVYDGVEGNNPCARSRSADSALAPEFWNGNAFVQLANKKFKRLICLRIDTSVGSVQFTAVPSASGAGSSGFTLTSGQVLVEDSGSGAKTATFTAAVAALLGGAGSYPTGFAGGEAFTITIDNGIAGQQIGPVVVTFQSSDQTQANCISRINAALGYVAASDGGASKIAIVGRVPGLAGNVTISQADAIVTTKTGLAVGTTAGTGNVQNIWNVSVGEANTLMHARDSNVSVDRDANGNIRLISHGGASLIISGATTAVNFGFVAGTHTASASSGTIPAGTRVRDASAHEWVTMQDVAVVAGNAGPYNVKVRPATDDGSGVSALVGAVSVIPYPIDLGAFAVTNGSALTIAKTEAQLDAAYVSAIATVKSLSKAGKEKNILVSARQSNIIRTALRTAALESSSEGCFGCIAVVRPPLNSSRATIEASSQPGVGATRDQRVVYAGIGVQTYISQMAALGASGGAGYADDGIVDVGFDFFVASVMSQLPPEENPGQQTTFMTGALGLVSADTNPDVQDMGITDYTNFRSKGIAAPRIDDGVMYIQSGVTSVDPVVYPNLRNIARRRMADFIQDTLALRYKAFGKKLNTRGRRAVIMSETNSFLRGLQNDERIDSYSLKVLSDAREIAMGAFRIGKKVKTFSSLDSIILESTVGESVVIEEQT